MAQSAVQKLTRKKRISDALNLRLAGVQVQDIAAQLGVHRDTIHRDLTKAVDDLGIPGNAMQLRQINALRFENLFHSLEPALQSDDLAIRIGAVGQGVRVVAAQNRLLGLDSPTKTEHTITSTTTVSIEIRALVEQVQANNARARAIIAGKVEPQVAS